MLRESVGADGMKMSKLLLVVAVLILSVFFSGCATHTSEPEAGIQIDKAAPDFRLPDLKGREFSLGQYKGKVVLLDFWTTYCAPCRMTMPVLEKLQEEYQGKLALLAINLQEPRDIVREYVRRQKLNSQVLLDEDGTVAQAYGAYAIPMQVLVDKKGIVRYVQLGFNPRMAAQLRTEIEKWL